MDIDLQVLRSLESEREISFTVLIDAIEQALYSAYLKTPGAYEQARAEVDRVSGKVRIWAREELVPATTDAETGITTPAQFSAEFEHTPDNFGWIAASTARQIIMQRLRQAGDDQVLGSFKGREGQLVSGVIKQSSDPRNVRVDLGEVEAFLPDHEQVVGENYRHGERIRAYIVKVASGPRGPVITLSRSHPELLRRLFELEVPEIERGEVEIVNLAREAGHRSKVAVRSLNPKVPAGGAFIGPMGARVRAVMGELNGEKIDIIDWHVDLAVFVANALSPARAAMAEVVDSDKRMVRVVVPEFQLSLAIGRDGQNARLAAKLTGAKIDIHSDAE